MLLPTKSLTITLLAAFCFTLLAGCGDDKTGTDKKTPNAKTNHDVLMTDEEKEQLRKETATWATAMKHIQSFAETIRTETTGGTPAKAHRALDKLELVLKRLPKIAEDSNIPKEDLETIPDLAGQLSTAFNKVHDNIDHGKAPDYESVAKEIESAMAKLIAIKAS